MIYNFKEISGLLACSGQPTKEQFDTIAAEGYKVVINLGLSGTKYTLADEARIVERHGIVYHHIPVQFDDPKSEELLEFIGLMNQYQNEKNLVHCVANYRASAFTGLYLFSAGKLDEDAMHEFISSVWQPDAVWQQFISDGVALLQNNP